MEHGKSSLTLGKTNLSRTNLLGMNDINGGVFSAGIQSLNTFSTIGTTSNFNNQFNDIFNNLNELRQEYQQSVNELLTSGSDTKDALRNKGVELAWKYEQAELQMGGEGTRDWSDSQRQEILDSGRLRGAEGHHINSVGENPEHQANPDNIKFAENRREHLEMHDGDWRNPTSGETIDRNDRLERANKSRVLKNELSGIGAAAAIGLGIGFTLGFVVTLAQSGVSAENLKNASIAGAKLGVESAALGVINHVVARSIGEVATNFLQGTLTNLGLRVTENIVKMCNMGVMGGLAITVFCVYQFAKLKLQGYSTRECLIRVGRSAAFSISVLVLSIVAQGIYGGAAGIIVSMGIGIIVMGYKVGESKYKTYLGEKIKIYAINKCLPAL